MNERSDRHADRNELEAPEARFRRQLAELDQVYKCSPVGLLVVDRSLRFVRINERIAEIDGISAEDHIGRTLDEVLPELAGKIKSVYQSVLDTGEPILGIEVSGTTPKAPGRTRHWLASYFPLRSDTGEIIGVLAAVMEITERKQAEEAFRESSQMLKLVLDTIPVAVWWKDRQSVFLGCNQLFATNAGLTSPEEIAGKTDLELPWDSAEAEKYRADDRAVMETGAPRINYEETQRTTDGRTIRVRTSKVPLRNADGDIIGVMGTFEDITQRTEATEALGRANSKRRALEQRLEKHKRRFYRETILSVTGGKLNICEACDVRDYISGAQIKMDVCKAQDVGRARKMLEAFCASHALTGEALSVFMVGAGEAITNAFKHAGRGRVYSGKRDSEIWVGVRDHGPGIESLVLPHAVLWRGYSTKPSLGLGYTIMLDSADHINLKTGPRGTTVVLTKSLTGGPSVSLSDFPDTWGDVRSQPTPDSG